MPGIVRKGDMANHAGYSPQYPTSWSANVFINGLPVVTKGCSYSVHSNGDDTHSGHATGCGSVFCNGQPVQKVGDMVDCGSMMLEGSPDVSIG